MRHGARKRLDFRRLLARVDRKRVLWGAGGGCVALLLAASGLALVASPAQTPNVPDRFDPGIIIADELFYDGDAMTAEEVEGFLDERVPDAARQSLRNFTEDTESRPADDYCDGYAGADDESAADIIAQVGESCDISQRALLVILQKETALVGLRTPEDWRYDRAMGYACPDSGPNRSANCDEDFYGFANQLYWGARQYQVYRAHPEDFNYRPFEMNTIQFHPDRDRCGASDVYLMNWATAGLYNYTPYQPNRSALAAGQAEGDACATYGNRNFYDLYKAWFGDPHIAREADPVER